MLSVAKTEKFRSGKTIMSMKKILVPCDFSKPVSNAFRFALDIAAQSKGTIHFPNTPETHHQQDLVMKVKALQHFFNGRLHIVWINTLLNFTLDSITKERLTSFAKRFMVKNYAINVFNHIGKEEGILRFASDLNADLVALGTHGRRGFAHLINGSLAEDIVNHTRDVVWTYFMKNEPVVA